MVQFDNQYRQIKIKVVYYGPAVGGKVSEIRREKVMRRDVLEHLEPERADLRQDASLVRNAVGHHHVVGADAVGCDDEQVLGQFVDVSHLAGSTRVVLDRRCQ